MTPFRDGAPRPDSVRRPCSAGDPNELPRLSGLPRLTAWSARTQKAPRLPTGSLELVG